MRCAIYIVIAIACASCRAAAEPSGAAGTTAGTSAGTTADEAGNTAGTTADEAGNTAGSTPVMAGAGAGGDAEGDGGGDAAIINDPPVVRTTESVIAEPLGECPDLVTGTVTVLGTSVEILAGSPSMTGGPVMLAWHGISATGKTAIEILPKSMKLEITETGGIIFAPDSDGEVREGLDTGSGYGTWFTSDFALADELVACAYKQRGIDPRRIYTTGCASGAFMASALTIERSSYIASAVIYSGGLFAGDAFTLQDPQRVPSIITFYGTSELILVPFEQISGILADIITEAGGFAVECPRDRTLCGASDPDQDSAWEFLKVHPFGVAPFPYASGLPSSFPASCRVRMKER